MRAPELRTSAGRRRAAAILVALAVALGGRAARADDAQQYELAKGLYYAGQYEDVVRRVAILLDTSNPACASVQGAPTTPQTCHIADVALIERSREMEVVSLVALKRQTDADAVIEKILRQNPTYTPEPVSLPAAVVERVRDIKTKLQKELEDKARKDADAQRKALLLQQKAAEDERKWLAEMTRLASRETVIETRSRIVAFVPFGVGQLQNGDTGWGIFFAATELLAGGTAIGLAVAHDYLASVNPNAKNPETGLPVIRKELTAQMQTLAIGNQIAFSVWAALTVAGVIQANVAFVPETPKTRERAIPKRPEPPVLPAVVVSPQAVTIGVTGVF